MGRRYPGTLPLNANKTAWQYRLKLTLPNGEKIEPLVRKTSTDTPF